MTVQKIGGGGILFKDNNLDNKYDQSDTIIGLSSGNGFEDLKELDMNKDSFIDSKDNVFNKLKLLELDSQKTFSLQEKNISKLYTEYSSSNYDMKDHNNTPYLNIKQFSFSLDNTLSANLVFGLDFYYIKK